MPVVDLAEDGLRLHVQTEFHDKELIKQVPGAKWNSNLKLWTTPASWPACLQLRGVFGKRLVLTDRVKAWAAPLREFADRSKHLRELLDAPTDPLTSGLFPHQKADKAWLDLVHDGAALTNDMGTGKTVSLLVALRQLHDTGRPCLPALVVCPNSVKPNWADSVPVWFPGATPYLVTSGNKTKVLKVATADPTAVIIINYEAARTLSRLAPYGNVRLKKCVACGGGDETVKPTACEAHPKVLNEVPFRTVVVDEAHRMKDPKAKQTRAVWALGHGPAVVNRFAATGTPIANHIGDFWSIGHFIAPHEYPTRSAFLDRYALLSWGVWGGLDIVGIRPDTQEELFNFVDVRVRRVTKAEADLGLPPKLRSIRVATLPPKARKAYLELEADMVTRQPDGSIVFAPNTLTRDLRLMQLASAFSEERDGSLYLVDKPASWKLDVLDEVVAELGTRQFAVCALSRQLIDLASARFDAAGVKHGLVTGKVREDDRRRYISEFQAGNLQAMLFTLQAGGTGITLTAADTLVFLQRSWSIIDNKQAEDRVHRIGSEVHEAINLIDVIAADTVELKQVTRLHEKLALLEEFNRDRSGNDVFPPDFNDDLRKEIL